MTREELITKGEHEVRRNENLMLFYLQEFENIFSRRPSCAGCTFKKDWKAFVNGREKFKQQKFNNMEKTFKLKAKQGDKIHTYFSDKRPKRTYGYKMTEEFAKAYIANGTKEEISERESYFDVLPNKDKTPNEVIVNQDDAETTILVDGEEVFLSDATGKQMNAYAKENDIDFGDAKKVDDKRKVIAEAL